MTESTNYGQLLEKLAAHGLRGEVCSSIDGMSHASLGDGSLRIFERESRWFVFDRGRLFEIPNGQNASDVCTAIRDRTRDRFAPIVNEYALRQVYYHSWQPECALSQENLLSKAGWMQMASDKEQDVWKTLGDVYQFDLHSIELVRLPLPRQVVDVSELNGRSHNSLEAEDVQIKVKNVFEKAAPLVRQNTWYGLDLNHRCYECIGRFYELDAYLWPVDVLPNAGYSFITTDDFAEGLFRSSMSCGITFFGAFMSRCAVDTFGDRHGQFR